MAGKENNLPQDEGEIYSNPSTCKLRLRQLLSASGPIVATLASGMTSGFSAVLLPQLATSTSEIKVTDTSWVASVAVLPMAIGCILSGYLMDHFGRRITQLGVFILAAIGWSTLALAPNLWTLYLGRFITGLSVGILGPASLVYIAEISDSRLRGSFLASIPLAIATGVLCSHVLGSLLFWKTAAAVCGLFPLIGFLLLFPAPESPTWLVGKEKTSKAEETFRWLHGYSTISNSELTTLIQKNKRTSVTQSKLDAETLKTIISPSFLKPFLIMITFFFIQQCSGVNAVIFYSVHILGQLTVGGNGYLFTYMIDLVRVVMAGAACFLLAKFPRRTLAICSALGTTVSLFCIALNIYILKAESALLSAFLVVLYICSISIGIVPLPWIMVGEVFPTRLRELGSGSATCFGFLMFFSVVKSNPFLLSQIGVTLTFSLYGIVALFGAIFIFFCLPETRNKSLQQIEDDFKYKNQRASDVC